jgi:hypothetical protein
MPLTTVDQGLLSTNAQYTGFKNRLINGGMDIDQRNAGAAVTGINAAGFYLTDRWKSMAVNTWGGSGVVFTGQQNRGAVTPPAGFTNYLGMTTTTANASLSATTTIDLTQVIEGFNIADLGWGTANAQRVTLSFWAYSNLTGTFGGSLINSAYNRSYVFSYTISSANTWEYKTITVAGDTSGTWLTTNGIGITLSFSLGAGSSMMTTPGVWNAALYSAPTGQQQICASTSNYFYVTGVQLEKGSTATSFDVLPYGTEMMLCQRYYEKSYDQATVPNTVNASNGLQEMGTSSYSNNVVYNVIPFKVVKRATPTVTPISILGVSGEWEYGRSGAASTAATTTTVGVGQSSFVIRCNVGAAWVVAYLNGHWTASAEL